MSQEALQKDHERGRKPNADEWTSSDEEDLIWRFNNCEAALGVRSTLDRQIQVLLRMTLSDEALRMERARKRALKDLRHPRADRSSKSPKKSFYGEVQAALLEHLGVEPVLDVGAHTAQEIADGADDLWDERDAHRDGGPWEFMHLREAMSLNTDPYPDDGCGRDVKRAKPIDFRLSVISHRSARVLRVALGPASGDAKMNEGLRKKFPNELIELVVWQVAMAAGVDIAAAREITFWKSKDMSFVTLQSKQAQRAFDDATGEYGRAKVLPWN